LVLRACVLKGAEIILDDLDIHQVFLLLVLRLLLGILLVFELVLIVGELDVID